jgi:hypothetical protein
LFADLLERTGREIEDKKWVFILGCYNSGTTLLEAILSEHPEISGLGDEGVMLTDQLRRPEDFGWRRMWWMCEPEMKTTNGKTASRIKRHWSHFFDFSKPCFLEKSISNTARADFLQEYFKPAYFIHLVRNGYAVAEGINRKATIMSSNPLHDSIPRYPIDLCAKQWRRSLEVVEEQKQALTNFIEITYEQLTEDTDVTLDRVCSFLNIKPFERSLTNSPFVVHRKSEVITNMNKGSIARLAPEEIDVVNKSAEELLKKYNYYLIDNR